MPLARPCGIPKAAPVALAAMGSVDVVSPRLDMPSTKILLETIARQGKIPAEYGKDPEGWVKKYLDYTYLDKAQASLKK